MWINSFGFVLVFCSYMDVDRGEKFLERVFSTGSGVYGVFSDLEFWSVGYLTLVFLRRVLFFVGFGFGCFYFLIIFIFVF